MLPDTSAAAPAPAPAAAPVAPSTPPAPAVAPPAAAEPPPAAQIAPAVPTTTEPPAAAAAPVVPVVPEKYDFKVPEGYYDPAVADRVSSVAKDLKLPQEAAQRLLDVAAAEVTAYKAQSAANTDRIVAGWETTSKADKEIGGVDYEKNVGLAQAALKKFGTEALLKGLSDSGFGNHPELVRTFMRIGKAMKEDDFIGGGNDSGSAPKDPEARLAKLFDHPTSQQK